jgi:hypothetical protein
VAYASRIGGNRIRCGDRENGKPYPIAHPATA